jgi:hypothetical protein
VRHGDGRFACRETGVPRTFRSAVAGIRGRVHDIGERTTDQRSGVNGSDTGPDDGQEILSKIRV